MYHTGDKNVLEHRDLTELKSLEVEDTEDGQLAHMTWKLDPAKHYALGPDGQHERPFAVRSTDGIEHKMHPVPDRAEFDPFGKMTEPAAEEAAAEAEHPEVAGPAEELATEGVSEAEAPEVEAAPPKSRSRAPKTADLGENQ